MWRNADVLDFVGWLRAHNDEHPEAPVGWYGLDLYGLHASMGAVLAYLRRVDPAAEARARERYACFESFGALRLSRACEDEAVEVLMELQRRRERARLPLSDGEEHFAAVADARAVAGAEGYYRALLGDESGSLRDTHLADTLDALVRHLRGKVVVWAHNSHVGDARATRMGTLSLGQLCRQRREQLGGLGGGVVLVGFTTWRGTVSAASSWDGPVERKQVRPALPGSYEELFHDTGVERFLVDLRMLDDDEPRLERAIGVIYRPETEHYFAAILPRQLDFVLHHDETRAVEPLERTGLWEAGERPETYPATL
jgi:erythromycin esterase-like protein